MSLRRRPRCADRSLSGDAKAAYCGAGTPGFTLIELVIVVAIVGILAAAVLPLAHWSVKRQKEYELQANLRTIRNAIDRYHDLALAGLIEVDPGATGYPPDLRVLVEGVEITGELPSPIPGVSDEYAASGAGLTGGMSGQMQSQGAAAGGGSELGSATGPSAALAGAASSTLQELRGLLNERGLGGRGGLSGSGQANQTNQASRSSGFGLGQGGGRSGFADRRSGLADRGSGLAGRRSGDRTGTGIEKLVLLRRLPADPFTGKADWGLRCYGDSLADRSWCGRNVFDVYSTALGAGIDGRRYREW